MIVVLFTEVLAVGGVQRAGRHVAAVVTSWAARHGDRCRFLSLNDPAGETSVRVGETEFSVVGYARNKVGFALAALRAAGERPKLVIALHPHLAPVLTLMKVRHPDLRSVVFAHGVEVWRPMSWLRKMSLRSANWVATPSSFTAQKVISQQGIASERVLTLAWGLDPEFASTATIAANPTRGFPAGARIILSVGRWDPTERYKGADTLISSMPQLLAEVPHAHLVLIGEGGDRQRLEQLACDLSVSEHVQFLGKLTLDELRGWYAHCDVFALPSAGEGFGLVFLEAMACAKPVIGGAYGGTPDVIEDNVTGMLVPHGDAAPLAAALKLILCDTSRARSMGERGRARVEQRYTFAKFESRMIELLDMSLNRP
jgi:phosphatidylinositol alpha-1,6-mannosyltransferase